MYDKSVETVDVQSLPLHRTTRGRPPARYLGNEAKSIKSCELSLVLNY